MSLLICQDQYFCVDKTGGLGINWVMILSDMRAYCLLPVILTPSKDDEKVGFYFLHSRHLDILDASGQVQGTGISRTKEYFNLLQLILQ